MRVRATQAGFYQNKRYREGQEFVLIEVPVYQELKAGEVAKPGKGEPIALIKPEDQFSEKWMEKVEEVSAPSKKKSLPFVGGDKKKDEPKKVESKKSAATKKDDDVI